MSQRGLEALLRPKSIAVLGASIKPGRAGYLMMRNLLAGGFGGPVLPVTPKYKAVSGVLAGLCLLRRHRIGRRAGALLLCGFMAYLAWLLLFPAGPAL